MTNVFVSYSRHDKARVEPLVAFIDQLIGEVWWDDRFVAGESFTEETERRLNDADFVVVVWTPNAAHSKWVLDEAAVGRDAGKLLPISLDGQMPPLGFRHVHTLDFSGWNGAAEDKCALALKSALLRESNHPIERAAAKPPASSTPGHRQLVWRIALMIFAILAITLVGGLTVGVVSLLTGRESDEPSIDDVTADLIAGRAPDDPSAAGARKAVAEIGASERAEEKAAFSSFAAGDDAHALDILEGLAGDLERGGDREAAAEAYTRVGAIALLIDQGRGLAARRKALDLAPESLEAFQGLFFDTFLLQGYEPARALGVEIAARPETSDRLRGYAYALLAIIAVDGRQDVPLAEEYLGRIRALMKRDADPVLAAAAALASNIIAWRQDRLADADKALDELGAAFRSLEEPELFPLEVATVRVRFAQGAWDEAYDVGRRALDTRRARGEFIPTPLLQVTCLAGLYTERIEGAAPYCAAQSGRSDATGGAVTRSYSAMLAAARGDTAAARREIAAARALAPADTAIDAELLRVDVEIAAKEGDLDAAQAATWRTIDLVAGGLNEKSRKATAFRRFGALAIAAEAPARACEPLRQARDLYAAIGGDAGAEATTELSTEAGCP